MTSIKIDVPEGVLDDVPENLHIETVEDLLEALRQGHDIDEVALSVMRDEVGKPEREPLFGRLTRFYRYRFGNVGAFGKEARNHGMLSERMGYADDPVALRARHEDGIKRLFLELENKLVRLAEDGGDYKMMIDLLPTKARLLANVEKRLAERELKQAA